ncbi:hypothetical protein EPN95_04650 [Patescibacteria group bacterium]|nr:MAG: hypothetical protein EPN95_04650 [Patescibacteria group bacterium]
MPWPIIAAAAIGAGASLIGANKQSAELRKARRGQEAYQNSLLDFQRMIYGEGAPFRDLAKGLLPDLLKRFSASPESVVSPAFSLIGKEGLNLLRSNFSTSGDPSSGPAQIAGGRFLEGLGAQEADRIIQQKNLMNADLLNLAGFGTGTGSSASGQALSLSVPIGQTAGNIADLTTTQGAVQGGLYGSIGNNLSQLGLLYGMGAFNRPQGTAPVSQVPHYELG